MTGLEKITTQIIDDAKANVQKIQAEAEEEASKILASAKEQREKQAADLAAETQAQAQTHPLWWLVSERPAPPPRVEPPPAWKPAGGSTA